MSVEASRPPRINKTVVLIHGAWMTPASWEPFKSRFEAGGYSVAAPTWPTLDRPVDELRNNTPTELGSLTVGRIVDHYENIIRALPQPPLLVGHSFGGLYVQMLLDRGIGAAGVAIDPGPIAGVIPGPVSLAAALPVIARWNGWNRPYMLPFEGFARNFANTLPPGRMRAEYERHVVPTSGRIFYQAATGIGTRVNPRRRTQPLLITVADKDRTVTPYLARAAYNKQKKSSARTDFVQFPNRSHFLVAEPGWEEVADYIIDWAGKA